MIKSFSLMAFGTLAIIANATPELTFRTLNDAYHLSIELERFATTGKLDQETQQYIQSHSLLSTITQHYTEPNCFDFKTLLRFYNDIFALGKESNVISDAITKNEQDTRALRRELAQLNPMAFFEPLPIICITQAEQVEQEIKDTSESATNSSLCLSSETTSPPPGITCDDFTNPLDEIAFTIPQNKREQSKQLECKIAQNRKKLAQLETIEITLQTAGRDSTLWLLVKILLGNSYQAKQMFLAYLNQQL